MDVPDYTTEDLTLDERRLIADYKRAQNKIIPNDVSTDEIWVVDFNQLDYPNLDYVSGVRKYLDELEPYMRGLVRAAELRQLHYDEFYSGKREEEQGHWRWRILMNGIAEDAVEKYNYWKKIHDDELSVIITEFEKITLAGADERARQYEREERMRLKREAVINKSIESRSILNAAVVRRTGPTAAEKEELRQTQLREAEQKRIADEELLTVLMHDKTKLISGRNKKEKENTISSAGIINRLNAVGYKFP